MKQTLSLLLLVLGCARLTAQEPPLLKISDNHKYLVTEDDRPFFWLGGTAWELIHRLNRDEVDRYLADRQSKGFTVVQTVILAELDGLNTPNAYGEKPLIGNDPTRINEAYFEHVDYVVEQAARRGIYLGLLPTWGDKYHMAWGVGPEIFTPENARVYGEILGKRYAGHNNIVWILGGDRWPKDGQDSAIVSAMAEGIRAFDSRHLLTMHPSGAQLASNFFNDPWLDFDMFQAGHDRTIRDFEYVWKAREVTPLRPVVNGEPRYEDHPDRFNALAYGWMDDSDVRSSAYWSMLAGAAGYTYGCHDIWQMFDMSREPVNGARNVWEAALQLPGSGQLKHLKALLEAFPWQDMRNDQALLLNENADDTTFILATIGADRDFMLFYTPMGKSVVPDLSRMQASRVKAHWFNPRDGHSLPIGEFDSADRPILTPWSAGRGSDFVLVIVDAASEFVLPDPF
ncbi:MAG: glycoside hydrolase family 140 protein [Bacteroidales bacterium]